MLFYHISSNCFNHHSKTFVLFMVMFPPPSSSRIQNHNLKSCTDWPPPHNDTFADSGERSSPGAVVSSVNYPGATTKSSRSANLREQCDRLPLTACGHPQRPRYGLIGGCIGCVSAADNCCFLVMNSPSSSESTSRLLWMSMPIGGLLRYRWMRLLRYLTRLRLQ